jgi:uncharacterized protein (DUF983 family)
MKSNRTIAGNVWNNCCPKCGKGKVWNVGHLKAMKVKEPMHKFCSNCGLKYEREPGFWQGAMYVSYALSTAIFILTWLITYFVFPEDTPLHYSIILVVVLALFLMPTNWRWSRLIWLNFFEN